MVVGADPLGGDGSEFTVIGLALHRYLLWISVLLIGCFQYEIIDVGFVGDPAVAIGDSLFIVVGGVHFTELGSWLINQKFSNKSVTGSLPKYIRKDLQRKQLPKFLKQSVPSKCNYALY